MSAVSELLISRHKRRKMKENASHDFTSRGGPPSGPVCIPQISPMTYCEHVVDSFVFIKKNLKHAGSITSKTGPSNEPLRTLPCSEATNSDDRLGSLRFPIAAILCNRSYCESTARELRCAFARRKRHQQNARTRTHEQIEEK